YQDNQRYLWGILQDAAKPDPARTPTQQKIGDFFAACMDLDAIEAAGAAPLRKDLDRIASLSSVKDLAPLLRAIHARTESAGILFAPGVEQDAKQSSQQIVALYAGGLGLPDRDYYLKTDAKSEETRARYVEHVAKMLQLLGDSPDAAKAGATAVMR